LLEHDAHLCIGSVKHFFNDIDGWFKFAPAYARAVAEAPTRAVFVEVGCYKGRSTAFLGVEILNSGKKIDLHCVDIWPDEALDACGVKRPIREVFEQNLSPVVARGLAIELYPEGSPAAALSFADRSLDFVWLDGGHLYEEVRADLAAWLPKLKHGAIIGGDDWPFPNVARAVRETFGADVEIQYNEDWAWWRHRVKEKLGTRRRQSS
jgi:hypothetical protein